MNKLEKIIKRTFDIFFALVLLVTLSPVYLCSVIIIVISSPGNPIYKAQRVGLGGKVFTCYKFRSMHSNNDGVHITTLRNDNRVFPFGRFMRKTKIDELPQAINILLGHMSVVGPRPEDKEIADKIYLGEYQRIMSVKPGLTSIASLYDFTHGENCESEEKYEKEFLPKKLKLELYYIDNQSIIYDVKLIFKTAWIIFLTVFGKRKFEEPRELKGIKQEDKESVEDFVL